MYCDIAPRKIFLLETENDLHVDDLQISKECHVMSSRVGTMSCDRREEYSH